MKSRVMIRSLSVVTIALMGVCREGVATSSGFKFSSVSGSRINLLESHQTENWREKIFDFEQKNETFEMIKRENVFREMGVWEPPWYNGYTRKDHTHKYSFPNEQRDEEDREEGDEEGDVEMSFLSKVKLLPDEHHVSAYLHKGVTKRFLFINDKFANPISITITPCTSILQWVVKLWPIYYNQTHLQPSQLIKTYRTQRAVTFTEEFASRGVYSVDIRPINWDSYVHLYATSHSSEPLRVFTGPRPLSTPSRNSQFYQHIFTQVELEMEKSKNQRKKRKLNFPPLDKQINTNLGGGTQEGDYLRGATNDLVNKPRIWAQRLRGNRLHVRWDTSPVNPHLMNYCLVLNTRRDYSSLCSASGERFGVLPPDLMHVTYYDGGGRDFNWRNLSHLKKNFGVQSDSPHRHRHRHGKRKTRTADESTTPTHKDIIIGCIGKKTNYILSNLQEGRMYFFNVFLRDTSTNVSYPYVSTTLKYHSPKNVPNSLRDAKPVKIKLQGETEKTVKFNLNKPCSELSLYVMPCGGGSITFNVFHMGGGGENRTVFSSNGYIDSLEIVKVAMPQRGKYFLTMRQEDPSSDNNPSMVEVYVGKKNRRLPLPRLPSITKLTEDVEGRTCDSVTLQWWPSPDPRDNEYCIFLKEEQRQRQFNFKKPNQCDVDRSLRSDSYVTHSLCLQRKVTLETMLLLSQKITGLHPGKTYVVQLILRRHNGKSLSYDLHVVKTLELCSDSLE